MPLPLDEVFRRMAVAKGDVPATRDEREDARAWYEDYVDELTRMAQLQSLGDLTITHDSMHAAVQEAYREYRREQERRAQRRRLQDRD